jgi:hypothetical protein
MTTSTDDPVDSETPSTAQGQPRILGIFTGQVCLIEIILNIADKSSMYFYQTLMQGLTHLGCTSSTNGLRLIATLQPLQRINQGV